MRLRKSSMGIAARKSFMGLAASLMLAPAASAQQASGIAGVVQDTSGAVLPGVTVEASSPVLIEKVRTTVSNGEGRYNITNLQAGTYVVTFSLAGFKTVKREGIELTAGFTATVNGDLQVGEVAETVTVTSAAPLVDTQNVHQQTVLSAALLDTLPGSNLKSVNSLMKLVPGSVGFADVGGSTGGQTSNNVGYFHGKRGKMLVDGMRINTLDGPGGIGYQPNSYAMQEVTLETGGMSAEVSAAGLVSNIIAKEGSNTFNYLVSGVYTNDHLQSDNLTDALRARSLTTVNKVLDVYSLGATVGGPVKKDRLWFFAAYQASGNANSKAGIFYNATQGTPFYTPDLNRPAEGKQWLRSYYGRWTWQVSPKNKVTITHDTQNKALENYFDFGFNAPEAVATWKVWPSGLYQVAWSSPRTSRLLFEAAASVMIFNRPGIPLPEVKPTDIAITELSTGFTYNAAPFSSIGYGSPRTSDRYAQRASVSYLTGSHAFKAGFQLEQGVSKVAADTNGGLQYLFLNGVPNLIVQDATPTVEEERIKADLGLYVQDQWTAKHLTLNLGLRFDYLNAYVPAQNMPAGPWVPARDFAAVYDVPAWKDVSPRLGASYDLLGDGKTVFKVAWGKYPVLESNNISSAANPTGTVDGAGTTIIRTWTDTTPVGSPNYYIPNCDLLNPAANGDCGQISNQNFGTTLPLGAQFANNVIHGWGARPYLQDFSVEVQRQLSTGISVTGGYYRTSFYNNTVTDNLAVTPADYDPYCITAPVDARLPGGGGYQVCGLYDLKSNKFGLVDNLVTKASNFYGKNSQANCGDTIAPLAGLSVIGDCGKSDYFGASFKMRFASGIQLSGGVDTGRSVADNCFVFNSPQQLLNCHIVTPFRGLTNFKLFGSYPLPDDVVVSGIFQYQSGPDIEATYFASNDAIAPSLHRNLGACGDSACDAAVPVPLIVPQTQFEPGRKQLDLRLSKFVKVGPRMRLQLNLDAYNALNASSVLALNNFYGLQWQRPVSPGQGQPAILPGRLIEFGGQLTF